MQRRSAGSGHGREGRGNDTRSARAVIRLTARPEIRYYYLDSPDLAAMSAFLAAALSLPTVFFTVLVGFFLVYAVLTLLGALDMEWLDGLLGIDDVDDSVLEGALHALGVAGIPVTILGGVSSIFAWMLSFAGMKFLPDLALVKLGVGIGAAVLGVAIASRAVRPFRSFFSTAPAPTRKELVGKICTIRSLQVTDSGGTAEIGGLVADVRCFRENDLTIGSKAIVYDYDAETGIYHVGPIADSIADVDKTLELSARSSPLAGPTPES